MKNKALTTLMATAVTAALVLPVTPASASLNDPSVNHSNYNAIQSSERLATTKSTILSGEKSLTITSMTADTVRTSDGHLAISKSLKPIFKSANRLALQNAKATVVVKNGEITKITALTLNKAGTNKKAVVFDGGDATIEGTLTVSADYLKIQNLKIEDEFIVTNRVKKRMAIDNVAIGDAITFKPLLTKKIDWLNVTLKDTPVPNINVQRTKTMLVSNKLISNIHATDKAATLEVEADVGKLVIDVEDDFNLYGEGKIEQVLVEGGDNVSLESSHKINKVQINDKSAKVTLAKADTTALNLLISSIKYAPVSINGNEIAIADKWTTQAEKTAFESAVASAQAVARDAKASQTQVNDAYKNLSTALANYQAVQKFGKSYYGGDKTTLSSLINSIQYVEVSSYNGYGLSSNTAWTTQAEKNALVSEVSSAQSVLNNIYATYDQVSSAIYKLNNAITTYKNAHKYGYYGYADKSSLEWTINSVTYAEISIDGYNIPNNLKWTTVDVYSNFVSEVTKAKDVLNYSYATQEQVNTAQYNLSIAIQNYRYLQKDGLKQ